MIKMNTRGQTLDELNKNGRIVVRANYIFTPEIASSIGSIMQICRDRRGELLQTETLDAKRVIMTFNIPMNEIIIDFHDKIKSY